MLLLRFHCPAYATCVYLISSTNFRIICSVLQDNLPLPVWQRVLRFCLHNWEKAIILAVLLALIILVSVKVAGPSAAVISTFVVLWPHQLAGPQE